MKLRLVLPIVSLILATISCSPVRILEIDSEPGFQLSQYKTFDFFKLDGSGDTTENFARTTGLIKESIAGELEAKGLAHTTANPDLLVNLGIVIKEKVQTRETTIQEAPRYIGQRRYRWKSEEVEVGRYQEGTMTVDLVDPAGNEMVWRGVAEGVIPPKETKLRETIDEGVKKLFKGL